jgi:hypothetical protein
MSGSLGYGLLAPNEYAVGDQVIGLDDDGTTVHGVVTHVVSALHEPGDISVRWDGDSDACIIATQYLRLWPVAAQAARLAKREASRA